MDNRDLKTIKTESLISIKSLNREKSAIKLNNSNISLATTERWDTSCNISKNINLTLTDELHLNMKQTKGCGVSSIIWRTRRFVLWFIRFKSKQLLPELREHSWDDITGSTQALYKRKAEHVIQILYYV